MYIYFHAELETGKSAVKVTRTHCGEVDPVNPDSSNPGAQGQGTAARGPGHSPACSRRLSGGSLDFPLSS